MDILTVLITAVSLAMDAFAVSVCKGTSLSKFRMRYAAACGIWFGLFQALMPVIGYFAGSALSDMISSIDHWIVFVILSVIGSNMIRESRHEECPVPGFDPKRMLPLAVATSIDALAVGVSFAFMEVNIWTASSAIGIITFLIAAAGVYIGSRFGSRFGPKAEAVGGAVLIIIGLKILITSLI